MPVNFLVFIVDQLNASHLGCYGGTWGATPYIDALARTGWMARAAFVATPLCMPNRASLMTGRMPSSHGVRHNGIALSLGARTFVETLRGSGYDTTLVGKSHLQNITGKPPLDEPGRVRLPLDAVHVAPGDYQQESAVRWSGGDVAMSLPFYGFDHVELAVQHGDFPAGHYRSWLQREHPQAAALAGRDNARPAPDYVLTSIGQAWRTQLPEHLHPTHWVADRTIAHLQRVAGGAKPFLSYCSFPDPHSPYTPPGRFWDLFRPQDMDPPATYDTPGQTPPHLRWLQRERDAGRAVKSTMGCFAATRREVQEAMALNLGGMAFIDTQIGRVLAALRTLGLDGNTVVVFTSDHGEFAGDHQLLLKGPLHYDSLIRTPLIWREPGPAAPAVCDALVSTIDIAPTVLERAGVQGYNGMQGRSCLPLMDPSRGADWREDLLIEEEGQRTSYGFRSRVRMRTLRTREHRLSIYDGEDWGELYDLVDDPHECSNLWDVPASAGLRSALTARMLRAMLAMADRSPAPTALA